jgi:hypothetical protein
MKTKILIALISFFVFSSCHKSKNTNCSETNLKCNEIMCIAFWSYFDFKLIDKTSGQDFVIWIKPQLYHF